MTVIEPVTQTAVHVDTIQERTEDAGTSLLSTPLTDIIAEKTSAAGVTIDSCLIKDAEVNLTWASWTPILEWNNGSSTFSLTPLLSVASGRYIKEGRWVTFNMHATGLLSPAACMQVRFTLPFTIADVNGIYLLHAVGAHGESFLWSASTCIGDVATNKGNMRSYLASTATFSGGLPFRAIASSSYECVA